VEKEAPPGKKFDTKYVLDTLKDTKKSLQAVLREATQIYAFPKDSAKEMKDDNPVDVLAYQRASKAMWKSFYGKIPPEDAGIFYDDFSVDVRGETLPAFKCLEGLRINTVLQVTLRSVSTFGICCFAFFQVTLFWNMY
jgi:hypothetical protein